MVITFSDNYILSTPHNTTTIVWASNLVTTVHAMRLPAASVKIQWLHKIMSFSIIPKYWTVIHLRRLQNFRYNNIRSKSKLYCRHAKFIHNFRFLNKNNEISKAMQVKFVG